MQKVTIKSADDQCFGFILDQRSGRNMFFHCRARVRPFEDLREGQRVSYNECRGPKARAPRTVRVL